MGMIDSNACFFDAYEPKVTQIGGGIGRFKKVLLLGEDPELKRSIVVPLREREFDVSCFAQAAEAIREVMLRDIDVIVCDLTMPHLPGEMFYRAVERCKAQLCNRFIFLMNQDVGALQNNFVRQVRGLSVWKPLQLHVLFETIGGILQKTEGRKGRLFGI